MKPEDLSVVQISDAFGGDVGGAGEDMYHLAEVVGEDDDGVVAIGFGELCDQIDSNRLPGSIRRAERLSS